MMKAWLCQFVVAVACCVGISGCTLSRWVTDSRNEVIPEASATTIRPLLEITQLSQERPALLVKLSKQLEGPIELQEHKQEQVQTIWGRSLWDVGMAWIVLPFSPIGCIVDILKGKPGEGVSTIVGSFLAAMGFNAPEGSMFHISGRPGGTKIDRTPMGSGTRTVPWSYGPVEVKADDQAPTRLQANENGYVAIDLKQLPVQLSQRSNDLALSISAPGGTVTAAESVTVPVATMVAWEQNEAARAKLEEENKAQWERDRPAREARERAAQARAAEEKRLESIKAAEEERRASIKAAAEARAYKQERARKEAQDAQDARETSEAVGNLLGVFAQMEQNKADRAQAQYDNQQRLLQAQQEQQRLVQEQQNKAYMAEAARAEAFNREAARASEERARQKSSVASNTPSESVVGRQLNSIPREVPQPSASDQRPLHIPQSSIQGLPGLDFVVPKDDRSRQEENRERERKHRENVEWYAENERKRQAEQAETNRQRDAEAHRQQQELTNRRLAQEASIAKEISNRIAEIQAEVNRRDAITLVTHEQGSCPPSAVIINNTKVHLWVTFEYTMVIVGERQFPGNIAVPVAPHQRTRASLYGAPSCDSGKQWYIPAGGAIKWQHVGRSDEP